MRYVGTSSRPGPLDQCTLEPFPRAAFPLSAWRPPARLVAPSGHGVGISFPIRRESLSQRHLSRSPLDLSFDLATFPVRIILYSAWQCRVRLSLAMAATL